MYPSVEHSGHDNGHKPVPLAAFRNSLERNRLRYIPISIGEYITQVDSGQIPPPPRNSADLIVQALTRKTPIKTSAGHLDFPAFSARQDDLAVLGINPSIEDYMKYISAESKFDTKDRIAVVVGPTGAAKSTVNKVIIKELEDYTNQMEPASVYGIDGCPINEDPLHVLDPETRQQWKEEKGIDVRGELCPDCQGRAEDSIHKGHLGFVDGTNIPLDFKVKPLQFSAKMQRGIGRIDPQTFLDRNASELVSKSVQKSNRGVLYLAEMGRIDPGMLVSLNDLFRGRSYSKNGQMYELDTFIMGEMTIDEWQKLQERASQSLVERIDVIGLTYPLSVTAEHQILQKRIRTSRLAETPHFSPQSLEVVAEGAVRTRLVEYPLPDEGPTLLSVADKAGFYNGDNVKGFNQADRKKIEEHGRQKGEGTFGISPPELWNIVYQVAAEQVAKDGDSKCVDYVDLHKRIADYLKTAPISDEVRRFYSQDFDNIAKKHDQWLLHTVERAYQDRFTERADQAVTDYLNEVDYVLEPKYNVKFDPKTREELPVDIAMLEVFEDAVSKSPLSNNDLHENSRRKFRLKMQSTAGMIVSDKKKQGEESPQLTHRDFYGKIPDFEEGIKNFLKKQGLEDPKETLTTLTPTAEQSKKLAELEERMIKEHGFCECCAPKMRLYIRDLLRKGQV